MRTLLLALIAGFGFLGAATCEADGFFRRIPEVGEWARYELTMESRISEKPENLEVPEIVGSLTLKCVGEESIDDMRHLWLEARMDYDYYSGTSHSTLFKLLVPAEQIVDGDLKQAAVRAWCRESEAEPRALVVAGDAFLQEHAAIAVLNAFPASHSTAGRRQRKTMTIDGEEVQLAAYESGDLHPYELEVARIEGEAMWWPSADHAFGIAAAELRWRVTAPEEQQQMSISRMELAETGTGAESDLPDNN
jgi:hypothetical protein